ncbi:MAG: SH3 domain-containing protein [Chloroflexi bacterium]|nr:SH3 domain-containing protein [Chloroflexota bacterium]MCA2000405.1 SH3 domain-containing protein [Chloroflexota bacterium]
MRQNRFRLIYLLFAFFFFVPAIFSWSHAVSPALALQITPTPAAEGLFIKVITDEPQINVRLGPNSLIYPIVGTLPKGSTAPALGRSPGGDWIQIEYPGAPNGVGWVYSPLVQVSPPGTLRIVEPPPTPVPPATSTIDPTLAAQFTVLPTNTRLPTFTPPPALKTLDYMDEAAENSVGSISLAVIIFTLAALGGAGFLISLFLRR